MGKFGRIPTHNDLAPIPHPDAPTKQHLHAIVRIFDHSEAYSVVYAMFEQLEGYRDDRMAMWLCSDVWVPFGSPHMWTGMAPTQPWEVIAYGEQGDEGPDALFWLAVNGWNALRRWDVPEVPREPEPATGGFLLIPPVRRRKRSSRH